MNLITRIRFTSGFKQKTVYIWVKKAATTVCHSINLWYTIVMKNVTIHIKYENNIHCVMSNDCIEENVNDVWFYFTFTIKFVNELNVNDVWFYFTIKFVTQCQWCLILHLPLSLSMNSMSICCWYLLEYTILPLINWSKQTPASITISYMYINWDSNSCLI